MDDAPTVYSTEKGRICARCGRPRAKCICRRSREAAGRKDRGDGILRIRREVKGRKGKTVTTVSGFQESEAAIRKVAASLKNRCGTGGSVKDGVILLQGDHRDALMEELTRQGFSVKFSGG
jgi:translation initiation factor 1